jgi:hypothetical protein
MSFSCLLPRLLRHSEDIFISFHFAFIASPNKKKLFVCHVKQINITLFTIPFAPLLVDLFLCLRIVQSRGKIAFQWTLTGRSPLFLWLSTGEEEVFLAEKFTPSRHKSSLETFSYPVDRNFSWNNRSNFRLPNSLIVVRS